MVHTVICDFQVLDERRQCGHARARISPSSTLVQTSFVHGVLCPVVQAVGRVLAAELKLSSAGHIWSLVAVARTAAAAGAGVASCPSNSIFGEAMSPLSGEKALQ